MESRLEQAAALGQKDKGPAFISLINEIISRSDQSTVVPDIQTLVGFVVNQESVGLVVGRQVLSELVRIVGEGGISDPEIRKRVVEETIEVAQPKIVSYEEQVSFRLHFSHSLLNLIQVSNLRFQLADILEAEEEWSDCARVLMGIQLDSNQRFVAPCDFCKLLKSCTDLWLMERKCRSMYG